MRFPPCYGPSDSVEGGICGGGEGEEEWTVFCVETGVMWRWNSEETGRGGMSGCSGGLDVSREEPRGVVRRCGDFG